MKHRVLTLLATTLVVAGISAGVSSAEVPIGTDNSCASVFTEDVSACGSYPTPYIIHCSYTTSGHWFIVWSDGRTGYNPHGCW